ncbi:MAG: hypothetical protein L3J46_01440 [Kangiellaceae bacterium]|nr:hypothetical protein [Kangiellaceae bacterium]
MCSSPKSSGNARPRNVPVRGVFAELSQSNREKFAGVANAAQERREQRLQARSYSTRKTEFSKNQHSKTNKSEKNYPLSWGFKKDLLSFLSK